MADTDMLIGSVPLDVLVDLDGAGDFAIEGNFYLRHSTPSLSLIDIVVAEMISLGNASFTGWIRQDGRVEFDNASNNFTIGWTSTVFRNLLGFTANLSGSANYVSPNPSPLIWIPGQRATPTFPQGTEGYLVPHTTWHAADDGSHMQTQNFGSETWQELDWALVITERLAVPTGSNDGNTFQGLYRVCLQFGYRFCYQQAHDFTGTIADPIIWTDGDFFGPYQSRRKIDPSWFKRIVSNSDDYGGSIGLEMKLVEEYP